MLTVPDQLQCTYPESFISGRKYIEPIMGFMIPDKRPMDNVKSGLREPQEDEYALFRLTGHSPVERLIFPHSDDYFLTGDETFLPPQSKLHQWENAVRHFAAKLYYHTGKRIVFKNPFHSMRIPILKKLFPDALFIHIYRNPLTVIPSTLHMWTIVGEENALRKEWQPPKLEDIITCYSNVITRINKDLSDLPGEKYLEISFENLEKDPTAEIQQIYKHFSIDFTGVFEEKMKTFLKNVEGYKKNNYDLNEDKKELIYSRLKDHIRKYGY